MLTHYDEQQCRLILPLLGSQPVAIDTQELLRHYEGELLLLRQSAYGSSRRGSGAVVRRTLVLAHHLAL